MKRLTFERQGGSYITVVPSCPVPECGEWSISWDIQIGMPVPRHNNPKGKDCPGAGQKAIGLKVKGTIKNI